MSLSPTNSSTKIVRFDDQALAAAPGAPKARSPLIRSTSWYTSKASQNTSRVHTVSFAGRQQLQKMPNASTALVRRGSVSQSLANQQASQRSVLSFMQERLQHSPTQQGIQPSMQGHRGAINLGSAKVLKREELHDGGELAPQMQPRPSLQRSASWHSKSEADKIQKPKLLRTPLTPPQGYVKVESPSVSPKINALPHPPQEPPPIRKPTRTRPAPAWQMELFKSEMTAIQDNLKAHPFVKPQVYTAIVMKGIRVGYKYIPSTHKWDLKISVPSHLEKVSGTPKNPTSTDDIQYFLFKLTHMKGYKTVFEIKELSFSSNMVELEKLTDPNYENPTYRRAYGKELSPLLESVTIINLESWQMSAETADYLKQYRNLENVNLTHRPRDITTIDLNDIFPEPYPLLFASDGAWDKAQTAKPAVSTQPVQTDEVKEGSS